MRAYSKTTGKPIVGTSDTVLVTANVIADSFEKDEHGALVFEYEGESEVCWDSQEQIEKDGVSVFTDSDGNDVLESDIELRDE